MDGLGFGDLLCCWLMRLKCPWSYFSCSVAKPLKLLDRSFPPVRDGAGARGAAGCVRHGGDSSGHPRDRLDKVLLNQRANVLYESLADDRSRVFSVVRSFIT